MELHPGRWPEAETSLTLPRISEASNSAEGRADGAVVSPLDFFSPQRRCFVTCYCLRVRPKMRTTGPASQTSGRAARRRLAAIDLAWDAPRASSLGRETSPRHPSTGCHAARGFSQLPMWLGGFGSFGSCDASRSTHPERKLHVVSSQGGILLPARGVVLFIGFLMFFEVFGGLGLRRLEAAEAAGEALEALEAQVRLQLWGRQLVPRLVRRRSAECRTPSDPSGLRHGRPGAVRTWLAAVCSIIVRALRPAGASGRGNGAATSPAAAARKQSWSRALAASCASSPSAVKKHHVLLVRSGRGASCELRIRWTAAHEAR